MRRAALLLAIVSLAACGGTDSALPGAPSVLSTTPPAQTTLAAAISASFDRDMDTTTLAQGFTVAAGAAVPGSVRYADRVATFTPATPLQLGVRYTATLATTVTDRSGHPLAAPVSWSFTPDRSFGTPVRLAPLASQYPPRVALTAAGAIAVWNQVDPTLLIGRIWTARFAAEAWAPALEVEQDGFHSDTAHAAVEPGGGAACVFVEADGVLHFRVYGVRQTADGTWQPEQRLENPFAEGSSDITIVLDDRGVGLTAWPEGDAASITHVWARPYAPADGWGAAVQVDHTSTGNAFHPILALDGSGGGLVAWTQSDGTHSQAWSARYAGGAWAAPVMVSRTQIGNSRDATVAMNATGDAVMVWAEAGSSSSHVFAARAAAGAAWGAPVPLEAEGGEGGGNPAVALDAAGDAIAVWRETGNASPLWARRFTVAGGWADAIPLASGASSAGDPPRIALDASGAALALWRQPVGASAQLYAARFLPASGWFPAAAVGGDAVNLPDLAMLPDGSGLALWTQGGSSPGIYAARFR